MIGFRNRIVHGYLMVSDERLYEIAATDRGDLLQFLRFVFRFTDDEAADNRG